MSASAELGVGSGAAKRSLAIIVEQFVRKVKFLTLDIFHRCKDDPKVYRTKERIFLICAADPNKVVDRVGKVIFRYRENIIAGDSVFFHKSNDGDFKEHVTMDNFNDFDYIAKKIRDIYWSSNQELCDMYQQAFLELLELYIDYRIAGAR
jgi:hypothetical protein